MMADGSRPGPALAALSSLTGRRWKLGPARNKVSVERDVAVRMRDGAVLLADHYAPITSAPRPTVLMRCPYGRGLAWAMPALLYAERGYHVLLQSCRGTSGSGGTFRPYADEADDGQDTVGWLRGQNWFDGRLATVGASYLAYVQWALTLDPPPELKAMVVQVSPHDLGAACFGHGPFELYNRLAWSEMMAHHEQQGLVRWVWRVLRAGKRLAPMLSTLPLTATGAAIGGAGAPWYAEWLAHPDLPGGFEDVAQRALGERDVAAVVVRLAVVHPRDREPVLVGDLGHDGDAVVGRGKQFAEHAEGVPVVVVAHVLAQRRPPVALGEDVLGPFDRQRTDGLDREPAGESSRRVGFIELLGGDLGRRRLVHAHLVGEATGDLGSALDHHAPADLIVAVREPAGKTAAGRVQQQPRRLDRVAGDRNGVGALDALVPVGDVADPCDASRRFVELDLAREAARPDLSALLDRIGDVRDQRRRLRVHLASLQAESAVDAVGPVAEAPVGDADWADPQLDVELACAGPRRLGAAGDRMGGVRICVRVAPRPRFAGDGQLELETLVVRL